MVAVMNVFCGQLSAVLRLAALAALCSGPGAMASRDMPLLDASSCSALVAAALRGGGHFPMGRAACGLPEPAQPRQLEQAAAAETRSDTRAENHARQLHLYAPSLDPSALPLGAPSAPVVAPKPTPARQTAPRARSGVREEAKVLPAHLQRALALAPEIDRVAAGNRIDPLLLHAIARIESRHNPAAVSHAGARGLMQVMPATGARFGVSAPESLHLVPINLEVSARYLNVLKQRFPGELPLVLAAYNAGEGAVERHGRRIPPFAETQAYVRKVLLEYALLRRAAGVAP